MVDLKDLGIPWPKPNEKLYGNVVKLGYFLINNVFKDSFEFYGSENFEEEHYQLFLADHKFYTDPMLIQLAITMGSDNGTPIPAPAYKSYVKHRALGPIMTRLYSYPIYGKDDGYTEKEKSMQYSVECFLKQKRIMVFPEGRISHDGKLALGKIGSAEIAWRAYHFLNYNPDGTPVKKKKKLKIIPTEISYSPIAGIPLKDIDKMTIRFGKSIDFEEEVVDKFYSIKKSRFKMRKYKDDEDLKKKLQIKLMRKVMEEIGSMTTINVDEIGSRILYDFAQKDRGIIKKSHFENLVDNVVEELKKSDKLCLLDHLKTNKEIKKTTKDFLGRYRKKQIVQHNELYPEIFHLNMDYILEEHKFKEVRGKNLVLYNYNLLEHLIPFKKIVNKELKKIRRS